MRTRIITIIVIGMAIGFLLALGVFAFLRAIFKGEDATLGIAFTVFVVFLAGAFIWYVVQATRWGGPPGTL